MWLDLLLTSGFTLACLAYVIADSKKPEHRANGVQATRSTPKTTK